jgi:hypothetical protein
MKTAKVAHWHADAQVVVDGYEQLSWLSRWRVRSTCRRCGTGLLVTAHADVGLPQLWQTAVTEQIAWRIVSRLLFRETNCPGNPLITRSDVAASLRSHGDNLREALFHLYDLYESRVR